MKTLESIDASAFRVSLLSESTQPFVVRGLVSHWPIVQQATQSSNAALNYLRPMDKGLALPLVVGDPVHRGRIAYADSLTELNAQSERATVSYLFDKLAALSGQPNAPLHYIGTAFCDSVLPGFRAENDLPLDDLLADQFMWVGNRSCIPAHYDAPDNLACNVAGRRKVTLFPPEQIDNLYVGPVDFTPAGRSISLVDIRDPDFERFPKYRAAESHAYEIVLEPGDALFIPSLWWHHIEGLEDINILVNYWWRACPPYCFSASDALNFSMAAIRELPPHQRKQWQHLFDHYVFEPDESMIEHIPPQARGVLGKLTEPLIRQLRAKLASHLNR